MQETMGEQDLRKALIALGERLRARTDIVVGGAGALILTGELPRATSDFDVLYSDPDIRSLIATSFATAVMRLSCNVVSVSSLI
jgi:hypothetical protein